MVAEARPSLAAIPSIQIINKDSWIPERLTGWRKWSPRTELGLAIRECLHYLPPEMAIDLIERVSRIVILESQLGPLAVVSPDRPLEEWFRLSHLERARYGRWEYSSGIASRKLITNAGVAYLVDAWQALVTLGNMKYHALGTNAGAEGVGETALVTELTNEYDPDNTRATGAPTESAANIMSSTGLNFVDAGVTIREHGLMSQAATGGGTLWDRSLTGVYALLAGEGLNTPYLMTATAGG